MKKAFRATLSVSGGGRRATSIKTRKLRAIGGAPSAPGQPPHRQTGQLAKSVKDGVVGAGRRVAVTWFTAPLLEGGVNSSLPLRSGKARRRRGGQAKRHLVIAPRPFRDQAIDRAAPEMTDVIVQAARERLEREL